MKGLSTGWVSVGIELAELAELGRELELLETTMLEEELDGNAELDGSDELDGIRLLELDRELLAKLEKFLVQTGGPIKAQYASLQVSGGQSGQLLPCGQSSGVLLDDLLVEVMLLELIELELTIDIEELDALLLKRIELLELLMTLLSTLLDVALLQTAPLTTGRCAGLLATPLFPCTPNSIVWPGLIRSFQPTPVAVNGLLPEIFAFQLPVRVVPSV